MNQALFVKFDKGTAPHHREYEKMLEIIKFSHSLSKDTNGNSDTIECTHPKEAVRRAVRGAQTRLECRKCGKVLLHVEVSKEGINYL